MKKPFGAAEDKWEGKEEVGTIEYADYEFVRKSKVFKYLENGEELFLLDMGRKQVYSSNDLRIEDLFKKLNNETVYVFRTAVYS